jgi:hypothetical protein
MMKRLCYLLLLLAAGCASLGIPTPTSFNERMAAGYTGVAAVMDGTRTLLAAGKLTPADAENVVKQCDNIVAAFDLARSMSKTDLAAANTKLTVTLASLTALQSYLAAKKG